MKGAFEAKKHAYRQTQDGVVISFVVHPNDVTPELAAAPLGTILMVGYSDEADDAILSGPSPATPAASPEPQTTAKETDGRRSSSQDKVVVRAVMLCKEPRFQRWLWKQPGPAAPFRLEGQTIEDWAIADVRSRCLVASRRDLAIDTDARHRFLHLEDAYMRETGQRTADPNRRSA